MLQIVGSCDQRLFGLRPAERLRRQWSDEEEFVLVASAAAVLGDPAVSWLRENPGVALLTDSGRPLAVAVPEPEMAAAIETFSAGGTAMKSMRASALGDTYIRKLRRRERLFARSLAEDGPARVEKELYRAVYKGVTDLVTKYVWPLPAFWVTKLCAKLRVHPNVVTLIGMVAMIAAAILWVRGELVAGLLLAWLMTFLDTVDGKLARVTATSSNIGNWLDHVTDIVHPPFWWAALAFGLASRPGELSDTTIWQAFVVILAGYLVGRALEGAARLLFGFNLFVWRPFDSAFRTIISRRNIILLIMTVGLIWGFPEAAFVAAAAWTLVTTAIHLLRFVQAYLASRRGPLTPWLA